MEKVKASALKTGHIIFFNHQYLIIEEFTHRTPGNLRAFYQAKMRNLESDKTVDYRFRTDQEVQYCNVETKPYQLLYREDENMVMMDKQSFEQVYVPIKLLGKNHAFIKEGENVNVAMESGRPLMALIPLVIVLEVVYTEHAVKGDTSNQALKLAKVETGQEIKVPLFIKQGDKIKVDTKKGAYIERVR